MMLNNNNDLFFQVKEPCRGEFKIKGSRFITTVRKVITQEEIEGVIKEIGKEFHDATHHCLAWKIGHGKKSRYHYSDSGEPKNTAGLPILKAIEAKKLSNIIIIVTRYFGGVKLGTGGLIRAYSKAATDVLKECDIKKVFQSETVVFKSSFEFVSLIHNIISTFRATLKDSNYSDNVTFTVEVRASKHKDFVRKLKDGTNGQVEFIR